MDDIVENRRIGAFAGALPRSPSQLNRLHEADAELLDLHDGSDRILVAKTDGIVEEIETGLYTDPELIGWMSVTSNLSDLAAVGADPVGVLVALTLPRGCGEAFIGRLAAGAAAACEAARTFILGGDTSEGAVLALSASAIGFAPRDGLLTRRGAEVGDGVYLTGPAGLGSVFALERLDPTISAAPFRPVARLAQGRLLRRRARCCIDTSDGVLHAVDTLARVNGRGFRLDDDWTRLLHPAAFAVARGRGLPPWLMLAGVHGEFELLFTVPPAREAELMAAMEGTGARPVRLGEVVEGQGVSIRRGSGHVRLDTTAIRNASATAGSDPRGYVATLVELAREIEGSRS